MTAAVPPARVDLLGLHIDAISEPAAIAHVLAAVRAGRGGWICPTNLDVLRQAVRDARVGELVAGADLVVADGMPLLWASRLQGVRLPGRVPGSSLIHTLSAAAATAGEPVFLLGGDPGVAERAAAQLGAAASGLRVAGTHCPPRGFEDDATEIAAIDAALARARATIVFVALGFPKQERLIRSLRSRFPGAWFVAVGASFSLASGDLRAAPPWMRRAGLEWTHRLAQEPRRLARRYLVDGIPFLVRVLAGSARRRAEARA